MKRVTVAEWTELFRDIGLSDDDMQNWHKKFEEKYPDGHQNFLEWLGLDKSGVERIRNSNR